MLLYILLAIAVATILGQAWLLYIFVNRITELSDENEALEQGFAEVTDAYETDSLQYEETIERLNEEKARFQENNSTLIHNARIDRTARHEQEKTIHKLREEVAGIRRQLDIAQVIISEHDANCLPHVVLSHMEQTETIPGL